ncbi:MAG: radical SAM protein [Anaerolineae bacterium]|nr:radical SAM protein [Anaerolineae bacterium]
METYIIPVTASKSADKFIIYRPRIGMAFVGNRAMATLAVAATHRTDNESATKLPDDVRTFLESVGFFQPDPPEPPAQDRAFHPTTAVLLMTNQCQLRCTYCYAAAGEYVQQQLTPELGRAVIDYVCQNAIERGIPQFELALHGGGEPTVNWQVLQECTAYARSKPVKAKITLTSNGVWSPRQRAWILENLDAVSISMDGMPSTQDRQRPFSSGRPSSAHVLRTIAELDNHEFEYGIRLTATAPWQSLPDDVRFICENTACQVMQVEPAFNTKRGGHSWPDPDEVHDYVAAYLAAHDIATAAERTLFSSSARLGSVTTTFCTAPYDALIVNPFGQLVTCYEVASEAHALAQISIIGRAENGEVIVDTEARDGLHDRMAARRQSCEGCFCYWSCAGDCYARAFAPHDGGHLVHGGRCDMNRAITRELLLRRIAEHGGVWRADDHAAVMMCSPQPAVVSTGEANGRTEPVADPSV